MDKKTLQILEKLEKKISNIENSMVTKHDAKKFATKDDLKNLATKDDVKASAEAVTESITELITNLTVSMDEKFAPKDEFDDIQKRVKHIEHKLHTA